VDNQEDFALIERIYEALYRPEHVFGMNDVLGFLTAHPELVATNQSFIGKEGYLEVWQGSERKLEVKSEKRKLSTESEI
jgi:hypothetical protein